VIYSQEKGILKSNECQNAGDGAIDIHSILRFLSPVSILPPLRSTTRLGHVKTVYPIELLRVLLALIGLGSAFMAGSTLAAVRKGLLKAGRHYAWMVRAVVCL